MCLAFITSEIHLGHRMCAPSQPVAPGYMLGIVPAKCLAWMPKVPRQVVFKLLA